MRNYTLLMGDDRDPNDSERFRDMSTIPAALVSVEVMEYGWFTRWHTRNVWRPAGRQRWFWQDTGDELERDYAAQKAFEGAQRAARCAQWMAKGAT